MSARGWTVVEFAIAVALGLIVTLLASGLLLSAGSNYRNHSQNAGLNDGGRQALDIMARAIRQGAYVNWDSKAAPVALEADAPASIAGLDARSISRGGADIAATLPAVAHGSDVLALRFSGSGVGGNGDGSSLNCAGFGVAVPDAAEARGWSIFYVADDGAGEAELRCKYRGASGWGADAIVRGVDSFQVLYGLDTDTPADGIPNAYVNASHINAMDAALSLSGATPGERLRDFHRKTYWKRVCSIRVALLLHGESKTRADMATTRFDLFGPGYSDAHGDDEGVRIVEATLPPALRTRARRVVGMTVALRNRSG
ncbi:MAG: PilW family protein [Pseudomonadota bacterium]